MKLFPLLALFCIFLTGCKSPTVSSIRENPTEAALPVQASKATLTSEGFFPKAIRVASGRSVEITNLDNKPHTLISDPHPTHDQIPSLYKILYKNEKEKFLFEQAGEYGIHTEENPSINLKIVVE